VEISIDTASPSDSAIDYLEAKYVRGVMVEDPDEKIRRKRRKKNLTKTVERNSAERLNSMDDDISGTEINGDRSLMEVHEDGQVWKGLQNDEDLSYSTEDDARSIYSEDSFLDDSLLVKSVAEQVHASSLTKIEADAKKRKPEIEKSTRMKFHLNESTKICSGSTEGILVELDDFSFFVNVGDLEMEEGHEEYPAIDWHLPTKHKSNSAKKRKSNSEDIASKTSDTSRFLSENNASSKTTGETELKDFYDTPRKDASTLKLSKNVKKELVKSEKKLNYLEGQAKKLFKEQRRLFELALKEISEMTEEQMPRKGVVETIKVTLSVPEGKLPGKDSLMFNNPRDPTQRLKVTIPANASPGGSFIVSLPVPKSIVTDLEENNFSKRTREALYDYSKAFDQWAEADWKVKGVLGETKDLTLHKEKMKKFDELVKFFPEDLLIPVDIPFLRKVVRRVTQNMKKRRENAMSLPKAEDEENNEQGLLVKIPVKGKNFSTVKFSHLDFV